MSENSLPPRQGPWERGSLGSHINTRGGCSHHTSGAGLQKFNVHDNGCSIQSVGRRLRAHVANTGGRLLVETSAIGASADIDVYEDRIPETRTICRADNWNLSGKRNNNSMQSASLGTDRIMRVLLVEDDQTIARFIVKGLIQANFAVDHRRDGADGLELALSEPYDAAIIDLIRELRHK